MSDKTPPACPEKSGENRSSKSIDRRTALTRGAAGAFGFVAFSHMGNAPQANAGLLATAADFLSNRKLARSRRRSVHTWQKQRAMDDYRLSLQQYGGCMSDPNERLVRRQRPDNRYEFEVAIVGSGYGGAVCGARLAQRMAPGTRLCILERGKEWVPGTFRDTFRGSVRENRLHWRRGRRGVRYPIGMLNFHKNEDVDVISSNGLGGGSLINAGVAVVPDFDVFGQAAWPAALHDPYHLKPFFQLSSIEMGLRQTSFNSSPKMIAQRLAARNLCASGKSFEAARIALTLDDSRLDAYLRNRQGMIQRACTMCGDCMSGCNVGAKNTLQMNYLPLAKSAGAEIYTQIEVRHVEKCDGFYRLHLTCYEESGGDLRATQFTTTARIVILAAGSLGSTELLMRSQNDCLRFSPALGCGWSGNGDSLGFIVRTANVTNSDGFGAYQTGEPCVGPAIQSITKLYQDRPLPNRMFIEDGNMPRAYANVLGLLMRDFNMDHVQVLFGMGHDGNRGRLFLKNGLVNIGWPGAKTSAYRKYARAQFRKMAAAHGGRYRFLRVFGRNLVTVHPLGGCNMADDACAGVVNDLGQVYDGMAEGMLASGNQVLHEGLYVADGSIVPTSLAANPLFTICALAERIAAQIPNDPSHADIFV